MWRLGQDRSVRGFSVATRLARRATWPSYGAMMLTTAVALHHQQGQELLRADAATSDAMHCYPSLYEAHQRANNHLF